MVGQMNEIVRMFAQDLRYDGQTAIVGGQQILNMGGFDPTSAVGGDKGRNGQVDPRKMMCQRGAVDCIRQTP